MKTPVIEALSSLKNMSKALKEYLARHGMQEELPKGHVLLKSGEVSRRVWFLAQGLAKNRLVDPAGRQYVDRFWKEGDVLVAKESFNRMVPFQGEIVLLENCLLLSLDHAGVQSLYERFQECHTIARDVHWTDEKQHRLRTHLLTLPVTDAYALFCETFKGHRISLQDIAAYLNVSPHTISRIRRKKD